MADPRSGIDRRAIVGRMVERQSGGPGEKASDDRAKRVSIVAKAARRVALALAVSTGVALLLLILWKDSTSALFFRAIMLGLMATTVFSLFEVWPRRLPP